MSKPDKQTADQSRRFKETAKSLGCDESGDAFDRAFGKIVPPKMPKPTDEEPKPKKPRK